MYAVAFILVPRERASARNLVRRIFRGSVKPYSLLAGGQQINVLRRRVQNASFHGAAPRAIAAPCHQHSPDPRHVVPWVEGIPASSEIRLEPSGEVHRTAGRRCAHVAEIAGAVARRDVHASAEGNSKM